MNQNEYEEMFREEENAPAEAATSYQSENQKVPEQNHDTTIASKPSMFDEKLMAKLISDALADASAYAFRHPRFYDIAWHLEQIRKILEGEK